MDSPTTTAPRLSILMPTLNVARYIRDALASIAAAPFAASAEVLVLDGDSTDATVAIAREFAPLAVVSIERDGSLYQALNRGLGLARAPLVGWLNADDLLDGAGMARVLDAITADPALDVAYGDYDEWIVDSGERKPWRQSEGALARYRDGDMRGGWVTPLTAIWRTQSLRRLGGWDPTYRISGDQHLWMRAACTTPPLRERHVPVVVGTFRTHEDSLSAGGRHLDRILAEELRLTQEGLRRGDAPVALRRAYDRRRREAVRHSVWAAVRRGAIGQAQNLVREYGDRTSTVAGLVGQQLWTSAERRLRALVGGKEWP
jgi:glycosyltransferase involved in cell wall biosynthesis